MESENKLEIIVRESGLESTKAQFILNTFQDYFKIAAEWEIKAKNIVITDDSQVAEMQMARAGRLFLKEKRVAIEKARKELKEQALREGKAIDGIANVLKSLIVPIEEYLSEQECFIENKKKAEEERLRLEQEKKIEEERIAKEKAEAEERERIKLENEKLKREADEREAKFLAEKRKAEAEKLAIEEKNRKERELLKTVANNLRLEAEKIKAEVGAEKNRYVECPYCHKSFIPGGK